MYRAILVDDEAVSLRFLRNYLTANFPQFEIAAEFETGIDALEFFRKSVVNLIITDVKMPIMSGVELAKCVRRMNRDVHIIIVSGYAEFDYAKGAIDAEVDEYLLKPVSLTNMKNALQRIVDKLDVESEAKRNELLMCLLSGQSVGRDAIYHYFGKTSFAVAVVRFGNLCPRPKQGAFRDGVAVNRALSAHMNVLDGRDQFERILVSADPQSMQGCNIATALHAKTSSAMTIIVDRTPRMFSVFREHAQSLLGLLDVSVVIGKDNILDAQEVQPGQAMRMSQSELRKIDHCLMSGNDELMKQTFRSWAMDWERLQAPQRWVEKAIQQIVECFLMRMPMLQPQHLQIFDAIDAAYQRVENPVDLMDVVWSILYTAHPQPDQSRRLPKDLHAQIEEYIQENYAEPLTIQSVSAAMGISQTYLSKLFRKYGNNTFNEFLTTYRMESAKRLLAENRGMRLSDIASMVGYEDQSYFCKVFRQCVGMTPGQFAHQAVYRMDKDRREEK